MNVRQQGDEVVLEFPASLGALVGTSNSTTMAITGLPSKYQPTSTNQNFVVIGYNAGAVTVLPLEIDVGSGTMTFNYSFSTSGNKGVLPGSVRYKITA